MSSNVKGEEDSMDDILTEKRKTPARITAVEDDVVLEDDVIPGPPATAEGTSGPKRKETSQSRSTKERLKNLILRKNSTHTAENGGGGGDSGSGHSNLTCRSNKSNDILQESHTDHKWSGNGILASREDLDMPVEEFAAGCNLLQAAARGDETTMALLLSARPRHVNFRDYDRRTALHVASSEGHLSVCKMLIEQYGSRVNRSDRWGGSPLDDAHRHRHAAVIRYLRDQGALTGSGNRATNLITAAAEGDIDEVMILVQSSQNSRTKQKLDLNKGDYDKRTALHLAAGEGHDKVVQILCEAGAEVNCEDRWKRRPLDDARDAGKENCCKILISFGAAPSPPSRQTSAVGDSQPLDGSTRRQFDNLKINFKELEMIDRIGAGAFGEIYKCRWRGTLVAAKIIKTAKIRREWAHKRAMENIKNGGDVDDAIKEMDQADMEEKEKDLALADFRQEISVLKSLRHPHIVLMLAYSTTSNYECIISELMKCSLLDVFKSHMVQGTFMPKKTQIIYAQQLAQGMNYLHTCHPPIIHRDLKPANLLIDHAGTLKISDFGLSKIRPEVNKMETDKFVMTGETGSYRFMAPEVYRHEDYNETVDIYSYAMILFYLLVGRPPWPTLPGLEAVRKASTEGDRPNIPRDMDIRMQNLLKECWDDNASVRPSFDKILDALNFYSSNVFHTDTNMVSVADQPPKADLVDNGCDCVIL